MVINPAARTTPSRGGATLAPFGKGALTGRVIGVDPGHNGVYRASVNTRPVPAGNGRTKPCNSSGTASNSGYSEHRFTWDVAKRLTGELRSRGAKVVLTRPDDRGTGPCVNERAAIGNRAKADLVISIHADGNLSPKARGFHIIRSTSMAGGRAAEASSTNLATILRRTIQAQTGMPRSTYIGRGTALSPRSDIGGLNLSTIPGVMLEAGNMRHPKDAALLRSARFQGRLAQALADGVTQAAGADHEDPGVLRRLEQLAPGRTVRRLQGDLDVGVLGEGRDDVAFEPLADCLFEVLGRRDVARRPACRARCGADRPRPDDMHGCLDLASQPEGSMQRNIGEVRTVVADDDGQMVFHDPTVPGALDPRGQVEA